MTKGKSAAAGLFLTLALTVPANALTCTQQALACAKIAIDARKPQFVPKCFASGRLSDCRRTCVFTSTDGRQFPVSGDCKQQ